MSVNLRKKKISGDRYSLYLDIYHKGKRHYEFLEADLYLLPKDTFNNKEKLRLAEAIRSKRSLELKNEQYGFLVPKKNKVDFFQFFQSFINNYKNTDKAKFQGCLKHFKEFIGKDYFGCNLVTTDRLKSFLAYLNEHLAPETASSYFKLIRRVIRSAIKEGFITGSPADGIVNRNLDAGKLKKDYLLPNEMQQLVKAPCINNDVKRAFIVAYFTGLRGTDVRTLRWREVKLQEGILDLDQNKTDFRVTIDLHKSVIKALGRPGKKDELVFDFPKDRKILGKIMRKWVNSSGIEKHITFHCARTSFCTNLLSNGVDMITVKELMGLRSLKMLEKYAHAIREKKRKAIETQRGIRF